jgi:stage III sporulation protein AG
MKRVIQMSDVNIGAVNGENLEKNRRNGVLTRFFKLDLKKRIQYLAILLVVIVILTIYFTSAGVEDKAKESAPSGTTVSEQRHDSIENQLKYTLSQIEGAGRVEVMITYEASGEIVPAISVDKQTSTTTSSGESGTSTTSTENTQNEVVTIGGSGGNSALVLKEKSPEIRGVIVVSEGANNIAVKLNLLRAVQTLLSVSPDQVDVYKMNNE